MRRKREKKLLVFAIIIFIIMLITTIVYYFAIFSKPERVIERAFDKFISDSQEVLSYSYEITPTVSNANTEKISDYMANVINYMNISLNAQTDTENMDVLFNIQSNYKREKLLNMKVLANPVNKETLIGSEDFIDTYIAVEVDDKFYSLLSQLLSSQGSTNQESSQNIVNLKEKLLNNLKSENCSRESVKIEIGGKTVKAKKNSVTIKNVNETDTNIELNIYTNAFLGNKIIRIELNVYKNDLTIQALVDTGKMKKNNGLMYLSLNVSDLGQFDFDIEYSKNQDTQLQNLNIYSISRFLELTEVEQKVIYSNMLGTKLYEILDNQGLIENKFELTDEEIDKYKNMKDMHQESIRGTVVVQTSTP